jgi:Flp pilus assembly protein TadD
MGAAYTELGEFKEAIEAHEKAIKIKPDSHKAYYNMGVEASIASLNLLNLA